MSAHWLAHHGLISESEADEAGTTVTHPDVSQIELGWGKFYADAQRLQFITTQSPWIRVHDFMAKLMGEAVPGQEVRALGINLSATYALSAKEREELGHRLAPREPWGDWGKHINNPDPNNSANGLISITMRQGSDLPNKFNKYIDVRIRASNNIRPSGLEIYINDHYNLQEDPDSLFGTGPAVALLSEQFNASIDRSENIIDQIMDGVKK